MSKFSDFFSGDFYSDSNHLFHSPSKKKKVSSSTKSKKGSKVPSKNAMGSSSKKKTMKLTSKSKSTDRKTRRSRDVTTMKKTKDRKSSSSSAPVYQNYIFKKIQRSKEPSKKYEAIFQHYAKKDKLKVVSFGSTEKRDYTQHKDKNYRDFYLKQNKIDQNNLMSPKTLEQMILWNKPSFQQSVEIYKKVWKRKSKEL